jgi:hypothetical protein
VNKDSQVTLLDFAALNGSFQPYAPPASNNVYQFDIAISLFIVLVIFLTTMPDFQTVLEEKDSRVQTLAFSVNSFASQELRFICNQYCVVVIGNRLVWRLLKDGRGIDAIFRFATKKLWLVEGTLRTYHNPFLKRLSYSLKNSQARDGDGSIVMLSKPDQVQRLIWRLLLVDRMIRFKRVLMTWTWIEWPGLDCDNEYS